LFMEVFHTKSVRSVLYVAFNSKNTLFHIFCFFLESSWSSKNSASAAC
jgi:hypothetical protein